jgi:hypothetical protein
MARNFGIRSRGNLAAPRIDSKRLRQIETAMSVENQERAFRTAEALQHVTDPWARADAKLDKAIRLADAIWAKKDRDWLKLVALQLGIVAALFITLVLVLR